MSNTLPYDVLGVPISAVSLETASERIHSWATDDASRYVFIRDVHGLMQAQSDTTLMELHQSASMITPDGMPLVWLGKLAGRQVSRTCGPDLMERVILDSQATGISHYFYGGKPGIAERLKEAFFQKAPQAKVVGTGSPPFRPLSEPELDELAIRIRDSGADIVWIGISTPKQEFLMRDLAPRIGSTLIGVGAAFDFHTGSIKRAPRWMQASGLEWLWRFGSEPKRLWRRYLIIAPHFIWKIGSQAAAGPFKAMRR